MKKLSDTELKFIKDTITTAGSKLINYSNKNSLNQKYATLASVVTQADIDTENFLRDRLAKKFPRVGFYSEETYQDFGEELKKDYVWVVDPIDGTLNFSRGVPIFGISVALMHESKPIYGAVYLPLLNEFFSAQKGSGAYLNGKKIFVRTSNLDKLFGASATFFNRKDFRKFSDLILDLNIELSVSYCTVFNYVHTAAGQYDLSISAGPALWDIAASWIIIEEAGGVFEIFHKDRERIKQGNPYHLWCLAGPENVVKYLKPLLIKTLVKT